MPKPNIKPKKFIEEEDDLDEETEEDGEEEVQEEQEEETVVAKPKIAKKITKGKYKVVQVPTNYGLGIANTETEEVLDVNLALAKILNDLDELKGLL